MRLVYILILALTVIGCSKTDNANTPVESPNERAYRVAMALQPLAAELEEKYQVTFIGSYMWENVKSIDDIVNKDYRIENLTDNRLAKTKLILENLNSGDPSLVGHEINIYGFKSSSVIEYYPSEYGYNMYIKVSDEFFIHSLKYNPKKAMDDPQQAQDEILARLDQLKSQVNVKIELPDIQNSDESKYYANTIWALDRLVEFATSNPNTLKGFGTIALSNNTRVILDYSFPLNPHYDQSDAVLVLNINEYDFSKNIDFVLTQAAQHRERLFSYRARLVSLSSEISTPIRWYTNQTDIDDVQELISFLESADKEFLSQFDVISIAAGSSSKRIGEKKNLFLYAESDYGDYMAAAKTILDAQKNGFVEVDP